ncbi:hypothetical protein, partial [Moorena sp. SIO2C4]|uniref:hypothetical protein n=1 Tax=Moorena sp. SIO2C4 TaxID=2607824 RepID=UPI00257D96F6
LHVGWAVLYRIEHCPPYMYIWLVGSALSDFQLLLSLNKPLPTLHLYLCPPYMYIWLWWAVLYPIFNYYYPLKKHCPPYIFIYAHPTCISGSGGQCSIRFSTITIP